MCSPLSHKVFQRGSEMLDLNLSLSFGKKGLHKVNVNNVSESQDMKRANEG